LRRLGSARIGRLGLGHHAAALGQQLGVRRRGEGGQDKDGQRQGDRPGASTNSPKSQHPPRAPLMRT
jgi:hypothetical protein